MHNALSRVSGLRSTLSFIFTGMHLWVGGLFGFSRLPLRVRRPYRLIEDRAGVECCMPMSNSMPCYGRVYFVAWHMAFCSLGHAMYTSHMAHGICAFSGFRVYMY